MRQLALETSGVTGSVALLVEGELIAEVSLPAGQRSGRSLAPAIDELLRRASWAPRDLALVSVTVGPGSFTGLRIGVTTAKAFAYAVGAEVLGVDTLDVIAEQAPPGEVPLEVVLSAERGQLFARRYVATAARRYERDGELRLVGEEVWLASLPRPVLVTGPAVRKIELPADVSVVDAVRRLPIAATVGQVAARLYGSGVRDDLWRLVPEYHRPSAAEEKWQARGE
ncbi:MAG: tRNA (adenosine(37)-N6)-threonylcarbamoyltransferase complex dimerization subunit type 1 TsaB [Planctomycetaceae bacterium]|nr:tRNA (adenosine(37)-N6)-threonylcarbamoyltransferase complex dimerization subunit type 1 TsaB [Planctomycetaceae bacterium]